jgi:hypothetical protein
MSKIVQFVPESTEEEIHQTIQEHVAIPGISGVEARQFYEDLLADSTSENRITVQQKVAGASKKSEKNVLHSSVSTLTENDFLKAAQNGNIKMLKKCLRDGININCVDSYGWTALMCACGNGKREVVSFLLKKGIDKYITDKKCRDAVAIAKSTGHESVANVIRKFDKSVMKSSPSEKQKTEVVEFFCDVCNKNIQEMSRTNHETSTVHLFNRKLKPKPDSFLIQPYNRGYQLMLKSGWDGEKGLGSRGQGQRYPVKTILKRDRHCLGVEPQKTSKKQAKVTHFGPNDQKAVERKLRSSTVQKRDRKKRETKSQIWERKLREEMNDVF